MIMIMIMITIINNYWMRFLRKVLTAELKAEADNTY